MGRTRLLEAPTARREPCSNLADTVSVSVSRLLDSRGSGINTNRFDEAQEQQLEATRRTAMQAQPQSVRDPRVQYSFRSAGPATEAKDDSIVGRLRSHYTS
ncbi:hypothetical protein Plhal710r2_c003g0011211 [Plasmopara halstedii]